MNCQSCRDFRGHRDQGSYFMEKGTEVQRGEHLTPGHTAGYSQNLPRSQMQVLKSGLLVLSNNFVPICTMGLF